MHIPDGFLEPEVWAPLAAVSAASVAIASRKIGRGMDERKVPLMGVLAAFVFAAQMVNFPVGGGTSGHLMGGVLIAAIVGPLAALLIMSTILILQALLFQDGGITTLGANIFNMGIAGAMFGYLVFMGASRVTGKVRLSLFIAAWFSVVAASAAAALELSLSGLVPLKLSLPAMTGIHAVIGIGEGAVTIAAMELIGKVSSESLYLQSAQSREELSCRALLGWFLASLAAALFLAPIASELPDGLERVAKDLGFIERGGSIISSPIPDYHVPGAEGGGSTAIAGAVGVFVTFIAAYSLVKAMQRKTTRDI